MGNTDSIPVISQLKSLVQVMDGDEEGARRTQENFAETAPVVSQITSLVHHARGNNKKAKEVQEKFLTSLDELTDAIPQVGLYKAGIYYAMGDKERGDRTMKSATGSLASIAGGIGGFALGGPVGASVGSFAASSAYDGLVSGIETAIHGQVNGRPRYHGSWEAYDRVHQGKASSGDIFDAVGMPIVDAAGAAIGVKFAKSKFGRMIKGKLKDVKQRAKTKARSWVSKGSKLRCRREAEYHLTSSEEAFATSHQSLPGSVNDILKSKWSHMSVPETVSNLVSLFIILRLILWNDKNGRTYSRELCSFVDDMAYIEKCQDTLMRTLRRMEDHLAETADDVNFVLDPQWLMMNSNDPSEVMIHIMATLYGIIDSMGRGQKMGVQWAMQLCMYEDTDTYIICEAEMLLKLRTLTHNAFSLGLTRQRRVKRVATPCPVGMHKHVKARNKLLNRNSRVKYESNHVPASSAYPNTENSNDLLAHRLPKETHQIAMTKVGTSKSSNVAKTLRDYEAQLIQKGNMAEAIKLDLAASYGRANVHVKQTGVDPGQYKSALVQYQKDMNDLVSVYETNNKITKAEAVSLHQYINNQVNIHNHMSWNAWFQHMEQEYHNIVKKNKLINRVKSNVINVPVQDRYYG